MLSNHELFFTADAFAVVGNSEKKNFPKLTYQGLKKLGKTVYPVDTSVDDIDGDKTYPDLNAVPEGFDRVILELPKEETKNWIEQAAAKGIKDVWVHMGCDTPEAVALAAEKGINLRTGTCAVMYVTPGFSFHSFHRWIMKLTGNY